MAEIEPEIHPYVDRFFKKRNWQFFEFQKNTLRAYCQGQSGLIHSPTGSGKTLAALLGPINDHLCGNKLKQKLSLLWITPLKALAADTEDSLRRFFEDFNLPWSLGRRTGDTSSSERAKQRKSMPTCLITTPESLSLLLSYKDTAKQLKDIEAVIVDEWHELIGSKRGVQLELCLAHLRGKNARLKTWGLSATIGNIEQAMDVLMGSKTSNKNRQQSALIQAAQEKTVAIRSIIPDNVEAFPWSGHMGIKLLPQVIAQIEQARSTLIFTNTRSQTEIWFEHLLLAKPEWLEVISLHHGSLAKKVRDYAEQGLREGRLKAVVCTSSLDLGVDFSPVEQVIQIGSPKGVARLMQRAGRSGHSPGRMSEVICVPTHALELVEIAAARKAAEAGRIESRKPLELSLDVLVQHCVTLALSGELFEKKTYDEIRKTHCFAKLSAAQWQWVLDFITRGGDALQHYPDYKRVVRSGRNFKVEDRRIANRHRMSVGTITSDAAMQVKFLKGGSIGSIEESFIARLKRDDTFLFNGRALSLVQVRDMTAYVRLSDKKTRIVPRWQGGRMPLSTELASTVRALIHPVEKQIGIAEMEAVKPLLAIQSAWSNLPSEQQLLIEQIKTREGYHLFFYPFAGRLVHEGLATLLAYRLTKLSPITFMTSANDYGFELLSKQDTDLSESLIKSLLGAENLLDDVLQSINASELAKRQFRDIARIAGLVIQGHPGNQKTTRQIQASSGLIYDVLKQYDSENLLLQQSLEEVMVNQLEYQKLKESLVLMREQAILLQTPQRLTPLAFPLWAERLRGQIISSEKWQDRVRHMLHKLEIRVEKEGTLEAEANT